MSDGFEFIAFWSLDTATETVMAILRAVDTTSMRWFLHIFATYYKVLRANEIETIENWKCQMIYNCRP